jgi:hypothetical protein
VALTAVKLMLAAGFSADGSLFRLLASEEALQPSEEAALGRLRRWRAVPARSILAALRLLVARIARLACLPWVARLARVSGIAGLALVAGVSRLARFPRVARLARVPGVPRLACKRVPAGLAPVETRLAALGLRLACNILPAVGAERRPSVLARALRQVAVGLPAHGRTGRLGGGQDLDFRLLGDRLRRNRLGLGRNLVLRLLHGGCRGGLNCGRLGGRRARGLWARERILVFTRGRDDFNGGGLVVALRRACCGGCCAGGALAAG